MGVEVMEKMGLRGTNQAMRRKIGAFVAATGLGVVNQLLLFSKCYKIKN